MRSRILRDITNRKEVVAKEAELMVMRYLSRNTDFPARTRMQAQLALGKTSRKAFPSHVRNRCLETGKGRGVMSDWHLCKFQFRLKALAGNIPGVQKASW